MKTTLTVAFLFFLLLAAQSASAAVTGTSTAISVNAINGLRANVQYPVLSLALSATGAPAETLNSVTISIATSSNASSTALSTSSFAFIGIAKDTDNNGTYEPGIDPILATTTVASISGATTTISTATSAQGTFFVVLQTAGISTFTDNGFPEITTSTQQKFVVLISTSTGVVASSTNATLVGATTTALLSAITHSQTPIVSNIGTNYSAGTGYNFYNTIGNSAGEMGTLNIYATSTSGAATIATTTLTAAGTFAFSTSTYYASLWFSDTDVLGNATGSLSASFNPSTFKPTVTLFNALPDRLIINTSQPLNGGQVSNCSNYQLNGSALSCSNTQGSPFINFFGNQVIIQNLSLSGTVSLNITGLIQDGNSDQYPLSFSTSSVSVQNVSVPTITSLSLTSGAIGSSTVITGNNFGSATGTVYFSGGFSSSTGPQPPIAASTTAWSNTSITATIPAGAQSGPVQVVTSNGLTSDANFNTFFSVLGNLYFKIASSSVSSPITTSTNMRIFIGGPNGMSTYFVGDSFSTTFNASTYVYTIPGAAAIGMAWAYDASGANLPSPNMMVQTGATAANPQVLVLAGATNANVSGTINLPQGGSCTAAYQNQTVAVMAMPMFGVNTPMGQGGVEPMFFQTNGSCQASYAIPLPTPSATTTYNVSAMIPPFNSSSTAALTPPANQNITITPSAPTTTANFTFNAASYSIYGQIVGANGSALPASQYNNLWVFGYQPNGGTGIGGGSGGVGAGPNSSGYFRLYVTTGQYKLSVGGPQLPMPIEQSILVTTSSAFAVNATSAVVTILLTPPTSYISGNVKDANNNAISGADVFAYCTNGPGGGRSATDSQGYYKMYVPACSSYTVSGFSSTYGQFPAQTGINVSNGGNATVNFSINSANFVTISGSVSQNGSAVSGANVWITQGQFGPALAGGQTSATGTYSLKIQSNLPNLYAHAATMGQGELANIQLNSGSAVTSTISNANISANLSTLTIQIIPGNTFPQVFLGAHSAGGSAIGSGFTSTPTATSSSYDTYQIQIPYSGSTAYTVEGGIPNYGPVPVTTTTISGATSSITITISTSTLFSVSGSVSGDYSNAYVWAGGPNGGGGTLVSATGTFSMQLRQGTYDIGVNKPGDIGSFLPQLNISAATSGLSLSLTQSTSSLSGTVYYNGSPIGSARVWAENYNGGWAGAQSDANGNFTLSVAAGDWRIHAVSDGYQLNSPILITAPASGISVNLSAVSFTPNQQLQSMAPSAGGIVQTTSTKVQIPQGALGSGSTNVQVSITDTMNTPQKKGAKVIGTGENISAAYASGANQGQTISTLSQNATIQFVLTKAQLVSAGITTVAQAQQMQIGYDDPTSNAWTYLPTTVTINSSDGTWANLTSITLSGTTGHFSTYAPVYPTSGSAPATPTGATASALNNQVMISWSSVSGAATYDVYRQNGANYPFLASTTNTSYTDSSASNGTTYYYKVSALDSNNNESAASAVVSATPAGSSPTVSYGGGGGGGSYSAPASTTATATTTSMSTSTTAATTSLASTSTPTSAAPIATTSTAGMTVPQMQQLLTDLTAQLNALLLQAQARGIVVPGVQAPSAIPAGKISGITRSLKVGSKGNDVKLLQNFLISRNAGPSAQSLAQNGATGYFGKLTKKALAEFQAANDLPATGFFGPLTRKFVQNLQ